MTLGQVLKQLRTEQGLTQPELAEMAGIEQSYLSKLENDKAVPSFDMINRVAQALNQTGFALISKLDQGYIHDHLGHMPEVAADISATTPTRVQHSSWTKPEVDATSCWPASKTCRTTLI